MESIIASNDISEFEDILNANYTEDGLFKSEFSVCIRTSSRFGLGFLTPNDLISRLVGYVRRRGEELGLLSMESYREVSDIVVIIVPQIDDGATLTLSLVDTARPLYPVNGQEIRHSAADGALLVVFNCAYSIPNADRVANQEGERHRRLALRYEVDTDLPGGENHVTTFAITPLWRERHGFRPAFNRVPDPILIPIVVGFKSPLMVKNHRQLRMAISKGLITYGHTEQPAVVSGVADITTASGSLTVDANAIKQLAPLSLRGGSVGPVDSNVPRKPLSVGRSRSSLTTGTHVPPVNLVEVRPVPTSGK